MKYYLIELYGGTEPQASAEFATEDERDTEAKKLWADMRAENGDNVFKADVGPDGSLEVYPYIEGDLDPEDEDDDDDDE